MGLSAILSSSNEGLRAVQTAIQARSDNISNAQNPDYSRRDVVFENLTLARVTVNVQRSVDTGLRGAVLDQTSLTNSAQTYSDVFKQIGDIMGSGQGTPYLQQNLADFTSAWKGLEADPSSSAAESEVLRTGDLFAQQLRQTTTDLNSLETSLNQQGASNIADLNSKLTDIADLNKRISAEPLVSKLDPGLFDARDKLIKEISGLVGVTPLEQSSGAVHLYTKSGILLVAQEAQQFQWNNGSAAYTQPDVPPSVSVTGSALSLNSSFGEGKIGGFLDLLNSSNAVGATGKPEIGAIEKLRDQLNGLAGLMTKPAPGTAYAAGGLTAVYAAAASDRATDLSGGPVVAPSAAGTADNSLFLVDNTDPAPAAWVPRADTLKLNPALISGNSTIKRLSATAMVAALTSNTLSLNAGGVTASNRTYEGIAGSIAQYHVDAQARLTDDADRLDTNTKTLQNRLTGTTGVNMDAEVAQLTVLQNSYAANARVINTVQSMFDTLLALKT